MRIINDDETPFTGTFKVDGYCFGDRLLEGVMFYADAKDGVVDFDTIRVGPDDVNYFSDLNEKKWLAAACEFIKETDALETLDGKENVWVENNDKPTCEPQAMNLEGLGSQSIKPRAITEISSEDFFASLKKKKKK